MTKKLEVDTEIEISDDESYGFESSSTFGGGPEDMYKPADLYSPDGKHQGYLPEELLEAEQVDPYVMLGRALLLWVGHSRSTQKS